MKNLKLLILAFGGLGIASLVLQLDWLKLLMSHPLDNGAGGLIVIAGFVLPTLMGLVGLVRPPLQDWQAGVSLAGFAAILIKMHMWAILPDIAELPLGHKLLMIADVGGLLVSVLAMLKPEDRSA